MKQILFVNDLEALNYALTHGMDFAYPVDNAKVAGAVKEAIRDGYSYCGGALHYVGAELHQVMYK